MKHYLYKITNLKTNQFYIGVRSAKDPNIDKYMGSSSIWTKTWIKENISDLKKEILDDSFLDRQSANLAEVELLKKYEFNELCINCLYDIIPSHLGRKQSKEWIRKRIKSGEQANMYGKHHTEETKKAISDKLKGRKLSEETRKKIGNAHRNKIVTEEQRQKQSETVKKKIQSGEYKKTYKPIIVENIVDNTIEYFDGCILFAEKYNLNYGSVKSSLRLGKIYLKKYKITYAASTSNSSRKSGEIGESPEMDNPVGSLGSAIVLETSND